MHSNLTDIARYLPPQRWFERWWDPRELHTDVCRHNDGVPSELLFTRPQLRPLLEAHAASRFGKIRRHGSGCSIRLLNDQFPDFVYRPGVREFEYELTEASADRNRGDEYRELARMAAAGQESPIETFCPMEEYNAAFPAIRAAIERKAMKRYSPPPNLLVYVNFFVFGELKLTTLQAWKLVEPWTDSFASIWLLWGRNAVRCWPNPAKVVDRNHG